MLDHVEEMPSRFYDDACLHVIGIGDLGAAAHIKLYRAVISRFFSFGDYGSDSTERGELTGIALSCATFVYHGDVSPDECLVARYAPYGAEGSKCGDAPKNNFDLGQLKDGGVDFVIGSLKEGFVL